jgi:hypothetical protein
MKKEYNSPKINQLLEEMKTDPWYTKLKRWFRLQIWVYTCLTRKYWDKTYQHYIFKKK